jgi:type VI secretion system protein ImpA
MATLDAGVLLAEISADNPCGSDVEYDPEFMELEQVVHGKPGAQYGDTVVEATPPDWKVAQTLSLALFERTHDLRVAAHLSRALLNSKGIAGLAEGLSLVECLIEQHWDHVHPQLDPDDDNDPTARINALVMLVDQTGTLVEVRDAALVASRTHGVVRMRDIEYATGEVPAPAGEETLSLTTIEAIIASEPEAAAATREALLAGCRSTGRIETLLTERVGAAQAIDLSPLSKLLKQAASFISERAGDVTAGADGAAADGEAAEPATAAAAASGASGEISSRQDVIRQIDRICAYYERHEPSSPVPMLLQRARRLVDKSFIEILQDLAPEGLGQARQVGGIDNE